MSYLNPVKDREEWVKARKAGIGGSDAGVLLRVGWGSVTGLWKEKLGHSDDRFELNRFIYWGNQLEDDVLQWYAEDTGDPVLGRDYWGQPIIFLPDRPPVLLDEGATLVKWLNPVVSPKRPYARANVDGYALTKRGGILVPKTALEVKATGADNRIKWEYLPPPSYLVQCLHNRQILRECGLGVPFEIIALIGGNQGVRHWVSKHPEIVEEMLKREAQFWYCVQHQRPPKVSQWFPVTDLFIEEGAMPLFPAATGGVNVPPPPEGSYQAVLVDFAYLGEEKVQFQGKEAKMQRKALLIFALPSLPKAPDEIDGQELPEWVAGKTRTVAQKMTYSSSDNSRMYKMLASWFGAKKAAKIAKAMLKGEFASDVLLGRNAIITVQHWESKDGSRSGASFSTVSPLMQGMKGLPIPDDYVPYSAKQGEKAEDEDEDDEFSQPVVKKASSRKKKPVEEDEDEDEDDELPF